MDIKIIKIDGEFVIVELKNGVQKICPTSIFPEGIQENSLIEIRVKDK